MEKIAIGSDHAGFKLKQLIANHLRTVGYDVVDVGTHSEERADYPDFAHLVAKSLQSGECELGVIMCGSGNGIMMAANKHKDIRAALCWNPEIAALARQHNNANVIALPARFIDNETALECVDIFLSSSFEGGRHSDRVAKINC